jgi:hypothetical protein
MRQRWINFRAWAKHRPFVGALLTMVAGVELFFSGQLDLGNIKVQLGIEGLQSTVIPVALLLLGLLVLFMPQHRIFYGVISLVLSVYTLVGLNLGGFFVGMLLGAVGGILIVSWMPKKAVVADDVVDEHDEEADDVDNDDASTEARPLVGRR